MPLSTANSPLVRRPLERFSEDDLPVALMLIAFAAFACVLPAQSDTFYHLRSGQYMWESGTLIRSELFSWTHYGRPIANHWWLSQLVFYGIYSVGGPVLLSVAAGLTALAGQITAWRLARGSPELRLLVFVALGLTLPEWSVRPQVFSLLFTAISLRLVATERFTLLILLLILWSNMHAVVVLGIAIAGVPLIDALLWNRTRIREGIIVIMCAAATPFVTPYGSRYWSSMVATVQASRAIGLQEYRSAFNVDAATLMFWVVGATLLIVVLRKRQQLASMPRATRLLTLAAVVLFPAALTSIRNVPFFALAALPALARLIDSDVRPDRRVRPAGPVAYWMLSTAAVVAVVFVGFSWSDGGRRLGWVPLSHETLSAVGSCSGPLYNSFNDGGYIMWFAPDRKVFIDGRVEAYPLDFLLRARRADLDADYKGLFADYGIRCAVTRSDMPLYSALLQDSTMRPVSRDSGWAVFQR